MDGATLNGLINQGRAITATQVGLPCNQFRPITAAEPLGNQIGTINAAFNAADGKYMKPQLYGKAVWFSDVDGRLTLPGDYLERISDSATWFIAAQQQLLPIVAVECNRSVSVQRQAPPATSAGVLPYQGIIAPTTILGGEGNLWPASILTDSKPLPATGIPSGVKDAGWRILLPSSISVTLLAADLVTDDLGRRFIVGAAELTDLGWRINATELHT